MDDNRQELLRQLFAVATEFIEAAHEISVADQSGGSIQPDYADAAQRLQATSRDITVLADAAAVIARAMGRDSDPPLG